MTNNSLSQPSRLLTLAGQSANRAAARHVFEEYRSRKSANTLRAQDTDLDTFEKYLHHFGIPVEKDFSTDPEAWIGMTWGLVRGFVQWLLENEYAIGSINRALSTVKHYSSLAAQVGALNPEELALIRNVKGFSQKEKPKIDEKREAAGA